MKKIWWLVVLVTALIALTPLLLSCQGAIGPAGPAGSQGSVGPPGAAAPVLPGSGLKATISKVEIGADRKPVVTFTVTDEKGTPLKISDLDGYPSFILAYVKEDPTSKITEYVAYIVSDVKGADYTFDGITIKPVLAEVKGRAVYDPRATTPAFHADHPAYNDLGNGTFTYTFSTVLPENYDRNATHRVGGQITRATRTFAANPILDFIPAGGTAQTTRQVVAAQSCNQCHDPLSAHGGSRIEPNLCVTCHTSQTVDPETGNTVEQKVMVHKIHRGASLPSVVAGGKYRVVGFQQTVFEYSKAAIPQDIRNCTTCHGATPAGMKAEDYAKLAPDADNYKNKPSRAACGACHDQIDWTTGKSTIAGRNAHVGGPQPNDNACVACHVADSGKEFDASVVGAHTIPGQSKQLKGINVEIIRATNTAPGQYPTVVFTAKDKTGKSLQVSDISSMTFAIAGPTTDYTNYRTETASTARIVIGADGNFAYTSTLPVSLNATGSYAITLQVGRLQSIVGNAGASANVTQYSGNPVVYVPVTDKVAVPRRQAVSTENCNVCHEQLAFHGGGRKNAGEYCQFCHNPAVVDVPQLVPPTFGGPFNLPPQSIDYDLMIHRIHTGAELTRDFTIYRTRGVFNFNEIEFPGDRSNCAKCHVGTSYTLPLPAGAANTLAPREFYSPLGPAAAACLGCHDLKPAAIHTKTMTTDIGEACAICHGRGKDFDVEAVH